MKHVVGVGDMKVSNTIGDVIVTHALGSCIGLAIHDPVAHVAGILHFMLPLSSVNPEKARLNPGTPAPTIAACSARLLTSRSPSTVNKTKTNSTPPISMPK